MKAFITWCEQRFSKNFTDYDAFHAWSIAQGGDFWTAVWENCGVTGERGDRPLIDGERMLEARFFPDATLNFAENLLKTTGTGDALIFEEALANPEALDLYAHLSELGLAGAR